MDVSALPLRRLRGVLGSTRGLDCLADKSGRRAAGAEFSQATSARGPLFEVVAGASVELIGAGVRRAPPTGAPALSAVLALQLHRQCPLKLIGVPHEPHTDTTRLGGPNAAFHAASLAALASALAQVAAHTSSSERSHSASVSWPPLRLIACAAAARSRLVERFASCAASG